MDEDNDNVRDTETEEMEENEVYTGDLIDTRTGVLDDLLNEKLERALHKPSSQVMLHDLARIASEHDPIDLAHAASRLPMSARPILYANLPDMPSKMIFMIDTGSNTRTAIFKTITDKEIVALVQGMPPDEGVDVLDDLSDRRLRRVMGLLDPKKAQRIRELQKHDRDSAGRLMTNEFFAFPIDVTIGEISKYIRDNPGIDLTRRIFIYDEDEELLGFVPDRNLIINPADMPVRKIMQPVIQRVTPATSRDEVVDLMERYNIPALPVVDEENRLIGVIAFEDAMEALMDISDETIASIAGTAEDPMENDPMIKRFFWRAPWLLVTLCAGLITAAVMTHFRGKYWFVLVPFFVPLITGMSGNVGIQCSTLLVRRISLGEVTPGTRREAIFKEIVIGGFIGLIFGLFCGFVVYMLNLFLFFEVEGNPITSGLVICLGIFGACLNATVLGTLTPFVFARMGVDPAVSSGPIVTAFNDVLSTLIFFFVAKTVSDLLVLWVA